MKKRIKAGIAVALAAAVALGGVVIYRHFKGGGNNMMPMNMSITEKAERSSFSNTVTASGTVLLDDEIEVYAEGETNIVKSILVEEGDSVSAGDLLVEYDVEDRQEELEKQISDTEREIENAKLSLESMSAETSQSELTKLKNAITSKEKALNEVKTSYESYGTKLAQQQNTVDNARSDVEDAQKEVNDTMALMEVGGASESEYNTAVTTLEKAQKTLEEAEASYNDIVKEQENAKLGITTAENDLTDAENEYNDALTPLNTEQEKIQYEQQQLTLEGLQANLEEYKKDLSELVYSTSATVDGKVTEVCVDEGTYTEENTVILKVADFDRLVVSANIEEYDAPLIAVGQEVVMTSDGLEGKEYTGKVTRVNDSAEDTSTNMGTETAVPVEISVDNPDGILKPGYTLDLEITVLEKENVVTVSTGAVQKDQKTGSEYVYAVEGGIINKKEVTTGETNDTKVEITTGLNEGDEVISSPDDNIEEGMTLDEYKEMRENSVNSVNKNEDGENEENMGMMNGGIPNDQGRGFNQGIPSGGFSGGGPGGGGPMG